VPGTTDKGFCDKQVAERVLRAQAREILGKKWFHKVLDRRARAGVAQRKAPRRGRPDGVAEDEAMLREAILREAILREATQLKAMLRWATRAARSPRDSGNQLEIEAAGPRRSQELRRGHANDELDEKSARGPNDLFGGLRGGARRMRGIVGVLELVHPGLGAGGEVV
jgi:hypothetical protein